MAAHPKDGSKKKTVPEKNHQNDNIHVIHSTVSNNHTEKVPIYSLKITTLQLHESHNCML